MVIRTVLQGRDHLVLRALAKSVRLFTQPQLAALRGADIPNTRRRMRRLAGAGLAAALRVFAHSPPDVSNPLAVWSGFGPLPNAGRVSYAAKRRYENRTAKHMTVWVATNRTLRMYGVAVRGADDRPAVRWKTPQLSHDLGLSQVYVTHHSRWPADSWVGEDLFEHKFAEKVVDALILGPERDIDKPLLAIDFTGQYSPQRIREISNFLANRETPIPFELY